MDTSRWISWITSYRPWKAQEAVFTLGRYLKQQNGANAHTCIIFFDVVHKILPLIIVNSKGPSNVVRLMKSLL